MTQRTTPCHACPFARHCKPGALGGSHADVYVGQAPLAFWLPCHQSKNYESKESDPNHVESCAGAAIFRSNIGVADRMPDNLLKLPASPMRVFGSLPEFYAYHTGTTITEAAAKLTPAFIRAMMQKELNDAQVKVHKLKGRT